MGLLAGAVLALANDCTSTPGNVITNCNFGIGTYTSTIGGATNSLVPDGWTPNYGFDLEPNFDHEGSDYLEIGNYLSEAVPSVSQTFSDIMGATYSGSIIAAYGAGCPRLPPFLQCACR